MKIVPRLCMCSDGELFLCAGILSPAQRAGANRGWKQEIKGEWKNKIKMVFSARGREGEYAKAGWIAWKDAGAGRSV